MFAEEFFRAMGKILIGSRVEVLNLTYVEFEKDPFDNEDDDDPGAGYSFVPVVVTFEPKDGPF